MDYEDKLEKFTTPKCKNCGVEAIFETRDNGACGDPECCGPYEEYTILKRPKCGETEDLRLH